MACMIHLQGKILKGILFASIFHNHQGTILCTSCQHPNKLKIFISSNIAFKKILHLQQILKKLQEMKLYCIEFAQMISFSQHHQCTALTVNFAKCIIEKINEVHQNNHPAPNVACIPNTYNPSTGTAYYFTQSGKQLREMPKYQVCEGDKRHNACYDDRPEVDGPCNKLFPKVSRGGYGYMFL